MKVFVLLAALLACSTLGLLAQNAGGYLLTKVVAYDAAKLCLALDRCRFDNYRKQDERVTLTFKDGSTVELLSVQEMQLQGLACNVTIVTPAAHQQKNVFVLHPDGYVFEEVRQENTSLQLQKQQEVANPKNGKP